MLLRIVQKYALYAAVPKPVKVLADQWMQELRECNLSEEDSIDIRAGLIDVCSKGCDATNPFGASEVSPENRNLPGYRSFAEVLEGVLGSGYRSRICNENLISGVYPYGHDYLASDLVPMDSCFIALLTPYIPPCFELSDDGTTFLHILEKLQQNGNFIVNRDVMTTIFGGTITTEYVNTIRTHLIGNPSPTHFFRSFIDGDGNLVGRFILRFDNADRDSCTFTIRKPIGLDPFSFNDIAEILDLKADPDSAGFCYNGGAFWIDVRLNDDQLIALKGWAGCFNVCEKSATYLSEMATAISNATCVPVDSMTIYNAIQHICYGNAYSPFVPRALTCKPACISCDRLYAAQTRFNTIYSKLVHHWRYCR